ncbi:hypothetical protein D3C84_833630 [compost metagenome]
MHDCQRQAGIDASTIGNHRACAALSVVATFFGASQFEVFAQGVEQGCTRVEVQCQELAIHAKVHLRLDGARKVCCRGFSTNEWRKCHGRCRHRAHNQKFASGYWYQVTVVH